MLDGILLLVEFGRFLYDWDYYSIPGIPGIVIQLNSVELYKMEIPNLTLNYRTSTVDINDTAILLLPSGYLLLYS